MPRVVFLPDTPVDEDGNLFRALVEELELDDFAVDAEHAGAAFVAFVGKERAEKHLGRRVKTGRQKEKIGAAAVYVLPSTARPLRGSFYVGIWRDFASHVLGRDLAVRDEFKGMAPEAIKEVLDARRHPFAVCAANIVYDFNIGTLIRSANAFLAREILIYGRRRFDARGAMGAHHYMDLVFLENDEALDRHVAGRGYQVVVFEETKDAVPLAEFVWPEDPLMVFGQEGPGVPEPLLARADATVYIPQFGSMRSLNVGVASGIAMYDWHAKNKYGPSTV